MRSTLFFQPMRLVVALMVFVGLPDGYGEQRKVEFSREFAPSDGWVKPQEQPFRAEICLNGRWQFQPVAIPAAFVRNQGQPPELSLPQTGAWEKVPLKVPSPWNVNSWGCGRHVGAGTDHPYWPGSLYFPSYPAAWESVEMGWLRRTFQVPPDWAGRRLVLRFEAVAGECQIFVNGRSAGSHFDKYLPFEFDITRLVNQSGPNELLVGVRAHSLFNKRSERYPKMNAPYPCGSETERLAGIWQDVFLLGLPSVRVQDVFVKPLVDQDILELEVVIRNDSESDQTVMLNGDVSPWMNLAGNDVLSAPEPKWRVDAPVFAIPSKTTTIKRGETGKVILREAVFGRLKTWAPGSPQLYAANVALSTGNTLVDRKLTRFGWRQFAIRGRDLILNGQKIQLFGDLLHPFGPLTMSRRHAWAWYRMIQDFGGNAVRPHAQIHPRHYLELADEMGLIVLDETALFGSSICLNFDEPVAWDRFASHLEGLVLRDRNHPSVVGWSFGNELFAIFNLNGVSAEWADKWYGQLAALGQSARQLDPTRPWISCDGDEDLRGTLPVWSKHFGHGTPLDRLAAIDKPMMVGESGGSYYARPQQLAEFNGPAAFESYQGRNEALAIDVYDNIVRMARPSLAYYSASETAWFGIEHLNYGYDDFSRLPGPQDGVFLTHPFTEGKPGMQPERIPPYVATLNPGWDPALPLYKPLAMFHAQKAALAKDGPLPCEWDHKTASVTPPPAPAAPTLEQAEFIGERTGALGRRLAGLGVPLSDPGSSGTTGNLAIIDGDLLTESTLFQARRAIEKVRSGDGIVLLMCGAGMIRPEHLAAMLPESMHLTERAATALVPDAQHPWTASFSLPDLYFAEDGADRFIMRHGLEGPLLRNSRVLLKASNVDWSLFNTAPEQAKCAAVVLYEKLQKPSGIALAECTYGRGKLVLCALDYRVVSRGADRLWRGLLAGMGLKLGDAVRGNAPAFDDNGALIHALSAGRFVAPDVGSALALDFVGETTTRPTNGAAVSELAWQPVTSPSRDRFIFQQMNHTGSGDKAFGIYFSYWIYSPRALDDLLADGPDAPRFWTACYVFEKCRLFFNGRELPPARTEQADYRTRHTFENIPLKKGWNHFLIKAVSGQLEGDRPGTLAVRIGSTNEDYTRQLDSAVEINSSVVAESLNKPEK